MRDVVSAIALFLISACAVSTPERRPQRLYSSLLSASDIAAITALVDQRSDIRKPIYQITIDEDRRDRFVVNAGRWEKAGDQADYFTVQKRHGMWKIVSTVGTTHSDKRILSRWSIISPTNTPNHAVDRGALLR
jgi:hypothetical protein